MAKRETSGQKGVAAMGCGKDPQQANGKRRGRTGRRKGRECGKVAEKENTRGGLGWISSGGPA